MSRNYKFKHASGGCFVSFATLWLTSEAWRERSFSQCMKYVITIVLSALTLICKGQTNDFFGIWIGVAEYRVENIAFNRIHNDFEDLIPLTDEGEIDSLAWLEQQRVDSIKRVNWVPKPVPVRIDTIYYPVNVLLEIKENGMASYKVLDEPAFSINWLPTSKQNEIMLDSLTLRLDSANHLSLVFYEQDSLQKKFLFERISQSNLSAKSDVGLLLSKQSWEFSMIDTTEQHPVSVWFFENDSLVISVFDSESATYSTPGNWMIEEFSGHYFLFILQNFNSFCLHLTEFQNGDKPTVLGDFYTPFRFPFGAKYPEIISARLVASALPVQKNLTNTSKKLIGKWQSIDNAFPVDNMLFNQEVLSSFLSYEFRNDGSVSISFGGEVKDDFGVDQISKMETSDWSLASSGNIIIFDKADSSDNLAYFRFIDSNTIEFRRTMRSLEGHLVENMVFRMKRVNN